MLWLSFTILLSYILLCRYWKHLEYWKRKCVVYSLPVPFFGNLLSVVFRRKPFSHRIKELYDEFPNNRYNGVFEFNQPMLLVRDRKLLEDLIVNSFDNFSERNVEVKESVDQILSQNVYFSRKLNWQRTRCCIEDSLADIPVHLLFPSIKAAVEQSTDYLQKDITSRQRPINLEAVELFRRISNDVIASVVFGYRCNSLENRNNEFFRMSQKLVRIEGTTSIKMFLNNSFSWCTRIFRYFPLYPPDAVDFFKNLIFANKSESKVYKDECLMDIIMNNLKETKTNCRLSKEDILAQVMSFFFVGFEPLAISMSFLAYELAINVQVQKRLQKEIDNILFSSTDDVTYEDISQIHYLNAVILETLRKWPAAVQLDRKCTKDYILAVGKPKESGVRLEKGDVILIPVYGFHHDSKNYPSPEKFNPDRFEGLDLRESTRSMNYFPFGLGPRNCLAMELSILIMKCVFFELISKFDFTVISKTEVPLKVSKKTIHLFPENGIYLGLLARK